MDVDDGDSNALILPPKTKKNKNKDKDKLKPQINICKDKKLSKNQQRKLRRLEEEKKKEQLLATSLKTLEKYKIRDDAHSFLLSSEKIGQAVTTKEKRRREMHFHMAGLEMPESEKRPKRKIVDSIEDEVSAEETPSLGADYGNIAVQPVRIEKPSGLVMSASSVSSQGPGHETRIETHKENVTNGLVREVTIDDPCPAVSLDGRTASSSESPNKDNNNTAALDQLDDFRVETVDRTRCVESNRLQGPPVPPTVIHVSRPAEVVKERKGLPIIMMEQEIMEAINNHKNVIICGETGCGKTTQVPQFLYEAGYGSTQCSMRSGVIGVTQPRRVAVLSTARRVAHELGVRLGKEVGFQVRHDKKVGEKSSIKFMTDGILLRELQSDFLLKRYSVIILDEAHERSLNTDILIGMLSRVIEERQGIYEDQQQKLQAGVTIDPKIRVYPLKLILMSATLRVDDFTSGNRIFRETPPVINIPTRQFPVSRHFSKRTELVDYIGSARKMVLKIHKRLPPGGVLVFVTGQREVEDLCRTLRHASKQFRMQTVESCKQNVTPSEAEVDQIDGLNITEIDEALDGTRSTTQKMNRFGCYDEYEEDMDESHLSDIMGTESDSESQSEDMSDSEFKIDDEIDADMNLNSLQANFEALAGKTVSTSEGIGPAGCPPESFDSSNEQFLAKKSPVVGSLHVLPLYAMLPAAAQLRVFDAFKNVKEGERVVIVATNVAETSLTIPGIKYVVDTGREKVKLYNSSNGMESYDVQWISKASASQRAGRAGRTGPGHCYCLYSAAALTNEFPEFSGAEILKTPVDGVVLFLKSMNIKRVTEFPFPTPPKATDLVEAEKCLKAVEALTDGNLTPLGKAMAQYPMGPRHSKLLLFAIQIIKTEISNKRRDLVLGYAVAVAAALSLSNPFVSDFGSSTDAVEQGGDKGHIAKLTRRQIKENRAKLYNMKSDAITVAYALQCFDQSKDASSFCNKYALSSKIMEEMSKLRKLILQLVFKKYSGLQEAFSWKHGTIVDVEHSWTSTASHKNPLSDVEEDVLCQAICAGWPDRVAKKIREAKLLSQEDRKVNGVTYQASNVAETVFLRRWSTVSRSAPDFLVYHEMQHIERPYIHVATSVRPEWLVKYAGALCTYSPLKDRDPVYDPYCDQVFCYVIPTFGAHSWVLPPTKVPIKDMKQRIDAFAYVLLDGQVLPCLKSVKDIMSASPSSIFHPVEKCRKRVVNFLGALSSRSRTIDSCEKLREAWKQNGQLLHSEILAWFKDDRHFEDGLWPKMHQEALKAPRERFPRRIK